MKPTNAPAASAASSDQPVAESDAAVTDSATATADAQASATTAPPAAAQAQQQALHAYQAQLQQQQAAQQQQVLHAYQAQLQATYGQHAPSAQAQLQAAYGLQAQHVQAMQLQQGHASCAPRAGPRPFESLTNRLRSFLCDTRSGAPAQALQHLQATNPAQAQAYYQQLQAQQLQQLQQLQMHQARAAGAGAAGVAAAGAGAAGAGLRPPALPQRRRPPRRRATTPGRCRLGAQLRRLLHRACGVCAAPRPCPRPPARTCCRTTEPRSPRSGAEGTYLRSNPSRSNLATAPRRCC